MTPPASNQQPVQQLQTISEVISIEELQKRKYNLDDLTTELQLLKNKISTLRYEMISLMRLLATVNEDPNTKTPKEFFNDVQTKVLTLKEDIDSYLERFRKIAPLVSYAKKESGREDEPTNNVTRLEIKIDPPIFPNNQSLLSSSQGSMGQQPDNNGNTSTTSARGGRGSTSKRGSAATRKPRGGRGGSTASQRQNSRGGSKTGQTPQSTEYLGATPSEPILL